MEEKKDSICFFAAYFEGRVLPGYIRVYLRELAGHFSKTVLLSSCAITDADKRFLADLHVEFSPEPNGGYDFGLWYRAFQKYDLSQYATVALVNDSCVLFSPLLEFWKWSDNNPAEVQGMTLSEAVELHIQSYFIVLKGPAIAAAAEYFRRHGILREFSDVISTYEIGMSSHFRSLGLQLAAFVDNGGYRGEFSPYYRCIEHHLEQGMPLIKRRILFADYREAELFTLARMNFNVSPARYAALIKARASNLLIDPDRLIKENKNKLGLPGRVKYELTRTFFNLGRPVYRLFRDNTKKS